jgi:hypothetical protein
MSIIEVSNQGIQYLPVLYSKVSYASILIYPDPDVGLKLQDLTELLQSQRSVNLMACMSYRSTHVRHSNPCLLTLARFWEYFLATMWKYWLFCKNYKGKCRWSWKSLKAKWNGERTRRLGKLCVAPRKYFFSQKFVGFNINVLFLPELWHFGTDPDPWIRTPDLRIRILLFSSVNSRKVIKKYKAV